MLNNSSIPVLYRGVVTVPALGEVFGVYPDKRSAAVQIPAGCVIEGFLWGSATAERFRATAAALLTRLSATLDGQRIDDEVGVGRVTANLVGLLACDHDRETSRLGVWVGW